MAGIFGVLCVRHLKRIPARRTEHLIRCGGNLIHSTFGAKAAGSATDISQILSALLVSCIVYHVGLLFF